MGATLKTRVGPLSPHDFEDLLEELPAAERASLEWIRPVLRRAVDRLLEGELTEATILQATAEYAPVLWQAQLAVIRAAMLDPAAYGHAIVEQLKQRAPRLDAYLGKGEHAARLGRTLSAMFVIGALAIKHLIREPRRIDQLADFSEIDISKPEGLGFRLSVLVAAIFDAAERGIPVERARTLIERADLEGWAIAWALASEGIPGGPIIVPGNSLEEKSQPAFQTDLARSLWRQRKLVLEEEGGSLTDAQIEEELAARRGGAELGCSAAN